MRITADAVNNTLLIYANQENYRIIEQTLRQLDRPQLQVAIDATIAEITLNENLNYGVQFFLKSQDVGLQAGQGLARLHPAGTGSAMRSQPRAARLQFPARPGSRSRASSSTRCAPSPTSRCCRRRRVVVLDNQVATLQVGDQVPVATASATVLTGTGAPVVNTIDYRNTGVILRVVPRINANGNVLLDVEQEITNVAAGSAGSLTPTVSQRRVKSSIAVASGQTVLLAGLISEQQDEQPHRPSADRPAPELGDAVRQQQQGDAAHRTDHLHPAADHPRRRRCACVAEEMRTKLRGSDQRDRAEARADDLPLSQYKLPEERFT